MFLDLFHKNNWMCPLWIRYTEDFDDTDENPYSVDYNTL